MGSPARPKIFLLLSAILAIFASGCGYQFAASGSALPTQAKTIYVERFTNDSRMTGINDEFMRYLKDEIANHKRLQVVDSPDQADLILSGTMIVANPTPAGFNAVNEPTLYNQSIGANATLTDTHTHKVIWSTRGVSATDQFAVVGPSVITTSPTFLQQNLRSQDIANMTDIQVAATEQRASMNQTMQQLAQNLYDSMAEGF